MASGAFKDDPVEMRRGSDRVRDRAAIFFHALREVAAGSTPGARGGAAASLDRQRVSASMLGGVQAQGATSSRRSTRCKAS